MTDTLLVLLDPPPQNEGAEEQIALETTAQWLHLTGEVPADRVPVETGKLARLLRQPPADCRWVVLVPGESVLTTRVTLPKKRRHQALKALPYMLEDSVARNIAEEHLSIGEEDAGRNTLVAITRKEQLRSWLQIFYDAGVVPDVMLPDYAQVPPKPEAWQILFNGDRALVRRPDSTGYSVPVGQLPLLLEMEQAQKTEDTALAAQLILTDDVNSPVLPEAWSITELRVASALRYLAAEDVSESLNLLQNEFKVARKAASNWRAWRVAAVLAILAIGIELLGTGLETARLEGENRQLQAAMYELAKGALPGVKQIRDPQAQLLIAWRQLQGGGDGDAAFLPLLDRVSATFGQVPVTVQALSFKDSSLTVALQGSSLQQLDDLRQKIERQGLYASMLNAGTDSESAHSDLVISSVPLQQKRRGS